MALIFRYIHVPRADGTLRHAPYIPIQVQDARGKILKVIALLDSGADETVIPYDLAEVLGLTAREPVFETGGIGGSVKVKATHFSFIVQGNREKYPLQIRALIVQDKEADIPLILGRHGFFEQFHIMFKQDEEKIVLKKRQSNVEC